MPPNGERPVILVVDDEDATRHVLAKALGQDYTVHTAASATEGLAALRSIRAEVVLLDIGLPDGSGIELLSDALSVDPDLAVLMLTARADATTAARCMQLGAVDYVTKPFELRALMQAVRRGLRHRSTRLESNNLTRWLTEEVARVNVELRRERADQEQLTVATLEALVNALEAKDPFARSHSMRVADLAVTTAAQMGLADDEIEAIRTAGRLHDLGNIGVQEDVLHREGPLTPEQMEHVRRHVLLGVRILEPIRFLAPVVELIRGHHERWDGRGYPDGLDGDRIPRGARILAAAEVFDALTNPRPYQAVLPTSAAVERLEELAGTVLDPAVVESMAAVLKGRRSLSVAVEDIPYEDPAHDTTT